MLPHLVSQKGAYLLQKRRQIVFYILTTAKLFRQFWDTCIDIKYRLH
jgi:hypothetical protein